VLKGGNFTQAQQRQHVSPLSAYQQSFENWIEKNSNALSHRLIIRQMAGKEIRHGGSDRDHVKEYREI
jgi:hypothetical protein